MEVPPPHPSRLAPCHLPLIGEGEGTHLRRPLLFRLAGKEGGEKGRLVTVLCILPLNSSGPQCFGLAFHSIVTSCVSDYAPPDTGVSDLQMVAVEQLPSIEGTVEIRMDVTFLRGGL